MKEKLKDNYQRIEIKKTEKKTYTELIFNFMPTKDNRMESIRVTLMLFPFWKDTSTCTKKLFDLISAQDSWEKKQL